MDSLVLWNSFYAPWNWIVSTVILSKIAFWYWFYSMYTSRSGLHYPSCTRIQEESQIAENIGFTELLM